MPRFVGDPVRIFPRIGEMKPEARRVFLQPAELSRAGKILVEIRVVERTDINGAASVMFAAARSGGELEYVGDILTFGQFLPDDSSLPRHAAESGHGQ